MLDYIPARIINLVEGLPPSLIPPDSGIQVHILLVCVAEKNVVIAKRISYEQPETTIASHAARSSPTSGCINSTFIFSQTPVVASRIRNMAGTLNLLTTMSRVQACCRTHLQRHGTRLSCCLLFTLHERETSFYDT